VHLTEFPEFILRNDPTACHPNDEAIEKIDRFCHRIYKVPITWLCGYSALLKYGDRLKRFVQEYGDEVAIYEHGIATRFALDNRPERYQPWVEACGLKRPDEGFQSKEAEIIGGRCWHDMAESEQRIALTYLKQAYEKVLGVPVRVLATAHTNQDTIRIMSEIGLDVSWGYCWNYFCEGINHKGSLIQPFYISHRNHSVPEQEAGKNSVLAILWGLFSPLISTRVEAHSRLGQPGFCLNALEMAHRSAGLDQYDFHRKVLAEMAGSAAWNPFVLLPVQLEAIWFSEADISEELYDQYPQFNSTTTEVFYTQIETALRLGAHPVTFSAFADWHKTNVQGTAEFVTYSEDPIPDVRNRGKDQAYVPQLIYGSQTRQYWFDQSRGFNYMRKYVYSPIVDEKDIVDEYPYADEPRVFLKIKRGVNVMAGIAMTESGAAYELHDFQLTAYHDDPEYAAVLWQANLPSYVRDEDIETGGVLTGFRTIRQKNAAILFADLKQGENTLVFRSELPGKYIRIVSSERVGKRWEIWIENDAAAAALHSLDVKIAPKLKLGGFWWDGRYTRSIFRFGPSHYNRHTGAFSLRALYPATLTMNQGLTRFSIELV
jgi:hypothetical protein